MVNTRLDRGIRPKGPIPILLRGDSRALTIVLNVICTKYFCIPIGPVGPARHLEGVVRGLSPRIVVSSRGKGRRLTTVKGKLRGGIVNPRTLGATAKARLSRRRCDELRRVRKR